MKYFEGDIVYNKTGKPLLYYNRDNGKTEGFISWEHAVVLRQTPRWVVVSVTGELYKHRKDPTPICGHITTIDPEAIYKDDESEGFLDNLRFTFRGPCDWCKGDWCKERPII
jgi:hypothetical protein